MSIMFNLIKRPDKHQRMVIMSSCVAFAKLTEGNRVENELLPQMWEQVCDSVCVFGGGGSRVYGGTCMWKYCIVYCTRTVCVCVVRSNVFSSTLCTAYACYALFNYR